MDKKCKKHGVCRHAKRADKKNVWICTKCNSERVTKRKRDIKIKCLNYKGNKCERCGYNSCVGALEFHHKIESEKDFTIAGNYLKAWGKLKRELDKCILVCANCHREIHYGEVAKLD